MQKDKGMKDYGIIGGDTLNTFNLKAVTGSTMFPPGFLWSRKEWRGVLRDFSVWLDSAIVYSAATRFSSL